MGEATGLSGSSPDSSNRESFNKLVSIVPVVGQAIAFLNSGNPSEQKSSAATSMNATNQPSPMGAMPLDNRFYGHFLPEHFKKTNIINTTVRR